MIVWIRWEDPDGEVREAEGVLLKLYTEREQHRIQLGGTGTGTLDVPVESVMELRAPS